MIRERLIVDGDVQKVGYRDFVQKTARKLGVKGYVENLPDGSVQIVCEAEEPVLKNFVENI
ncbi:MAG: acylphosphatase, partial [Candidatus Brockarchaeota archaeon]|nr:acylphosphatase [Candidatus Brockarchaeota archaeon]